MTHVLVVDDDPDIVLVLEGLLENAGYEVASAGDGAAALEHLDAHPTDVVILDLQLPVVDGWTVLDRITSAGGGPPVVVLSANAGYGAGARARLRGAAGVVSKPFDAPRLLALVADLANS